MSNFFSSHIGRLRLLALFEGTSLIILIFLGVPLKRMLDMPEVVKTVGPIHGMLFLLFVVYTIYVSMTHDWSHTKTTWKVLLSSLVPFGTFFIDHKILKPMQNELAN